MIRIVSRAAVLGALFLVIATPPASAHAVSGIAPSDYRSVVLAITPASPGVTVRLLDLGRRIQLTDTSTTEVTILGYSNEPYLRVGPRGVYQNIHSPAVYLNKPQPAGTTAPPLPKAADAAAPPDWQRLNGGHSVTWRDSRTRWEGPRPPAVNDDPGRTVAVTDWVVPFQYGSAHAAVVGRILWVPRPTPWPWVAGAVVLAAIVVALGATRWWAPALSIVLALLVAIDAARSYLAALVSGGPEWLVLARTMLSGDLGIILWLFGAFAVGRLQQGKDGGLFVAVFVGVGLSLLSGLPDLPYLIHSQPPFAGSPVVARLGVIAVIGLGVGLTIAAVARVRRMYRDARQAGWTAAPAS